MAHEQLTIQPSVATVVGLEHCSRADLRDVIGGKAAGLGDLIEQGVPVPPGFVVTTEAYHAAIREAGLVEQIAALLPHGNDRAESEEASRRIQELFRSSVMQDSTAQAIRSSYELLARNGQAVPVAVRSSANAEDTAEASFAGQQDTYLWVRGADSVIEHVVKCWASLYTAHAIAYRARMGVAPDQLSMGVVIQEMVAAQAAGVMMTLNPLNGDRSAVYIESAFGLGEIVVRGEVDPDRLTFDKSTLSARTQVVGHKQRMYEFETASGSVVLRDVPAERQHLPSLAAGEAEDLVRLGCAVERSFGRPMDIEWAVGSVGASGNRAIFALQARPETVWATRDAVQELGVPERAPWDVTHDFSDSALHWSTSNLGEACPGVLTPLSWSVWEPVVEASAREAGFALGALNRKEREVPTHVSNRFIRVFYGRPAMQLEFMALLGDRLPGTSGADAIRALFGHVPDGMVFAPSRRRYPVVAVRLPRSFITTKKEVARVATDTDEWWKASIAALPALGLPELRTLFDEALTRLQGAVKVQARLNLCRIQPLWDALSKLVEDAGVGDVAVLSGFGGAEMAVISDLCRTARGEIDLSEVIRSHGFHGPQEGELISRVWRDDDAPLRRLLDGYRERGIEADPSHRQPHKLAELQAMQDQVAAALPRHRRMSARLLMKIAAESLPLRGVPKRAFLQALDVVRATARGIGAAWYADGVLADPDDVFFLTMSELAGIEHSSAVSAVVAQRRERRRQYQSFEIPGEWQGEPSPLERTPATEETVVGGAVEGIGVSRGVVEGVVRVVIDPASTEIVPGEILVAPTTDPSWSSIMFISAGLVVDIGGALSHAAVVARELGIPCVVNTRNATTVLRTGMRVRLDGTSGAVEILDHVE